MNWKIGIAHYSLFLLWSCGLPGCGEATVAPNLAASTTVAPGQAHPIDHDQSHSAQNDPIRTCAEAVLKVSALRSKIQTGFSTNDLGQADGPVHEVGHVLEDLEELAATQNLSEEQRKIVNRSIHSLFDSFGALDKTIHSGKGKTYVDLAEEIEGAIAALQIIFPETSLTETVKGDGRSRMS